MGEMERMKNGRDWACPAQDNWEDTEFKINETHSMISTLLDHTKHLSQLDTIASNIGEMKNGLMSAATGKDQIPTKTVQTLLKIMGWVILGLTLVVVFLLTGHYIGFVQTH